MTENPRPRRRLFKSAILLPALLVLLLVLPSTSAARGLSLAPGNSSAELDVLESDENHVLLELTISGYDLASQKGGDSTYAAISVPGLGRTNAAGKPQLPVRGALVGVPIGAKVSLQVLDDRSHRDPLPNPPPPGVTQSVDPNPRDMLKSKIDTNYRPDPAVYSSGALYPGEPVRLGSEGTLRSQRYAVVQFQPFQYSPASRELIWHSRLLVKVTFSYPSGLGAQSPGQPVTEGPYESVLRASLLNYEAAQNWRSRPALARMASASAYTGGPWFRVPVIQTGIYRLTCPQVQSAGANVSGLDPTKLQLFKAGTELAIAVGGAWNGSCTAGDYIDFYGRALSSVAPPNGSPPNRYSDQNIYWLTFGQAAGKRMAALSQGSVGSNPGTFVDTVQIEQNTGYNPSLPHPTAGSPDLNAYDHWYWASAGISSPKPAITFSTAFSLARFGSNAGNASLSYTVVPYVTGTHRTQISVNGNVVENVNWSGGQQRKATVSFPQSYLQSGSNTLTVTEGTGLALDGIYIDNFDIAYNASLTAVADTVAFAEPAGGPFQFTLNGFTTSDVTVFETTDPNNVGAINLTSGGACPCSVQFIESQAGAHSYVAVTGAARLSPGTVTSVSPANLQSASNGADYIVIAHGSLISAVQPLVNLRASQGLRVKVVDVQNVYDEFNDGVIDPQAIHDFLEYAYTNWQAPAPSFVLLVGDGNWDPRRYCASAGQCPSSSGGSNITPPNSTLIPPYLRTVDPTMGETASDNQLVAFNTGNALPAMSIGRLPVNDPTEATAVVNKILAYESAPPGDWKKRITLVADTAYDGYGNADPAGNFWTASETIANNAELLPFPLNEARLYFSDCNPAYYSCTPPAPTITPASAAKAAILAAINGGTALVSYIGHAGTAFWSNGDTDANPPNNILDTGDVAGLTNGNMMPVVLELTCLTGLFQDAWEDTLAETNVRLPGNGAAAEWAATGWGVGIGHDLLEEGFLSAVFQQGITQIGPAADMGKLNLYLLGGGYNLDLVDTYLLLGDPASRLAAATPKRDEEEARIQFDGWQGMFDPSASGGSYRINNVKNATAKFPFYGRKVTWITRKGPEEGKAQILIDGVIKGTFDGYSPTPQYNVAMTFGGLTLANHTLTIKVLGTKTNPAATGFAAVVDAFVVGTNRTEESSIGIRNYSLWRGVKSANTLMGTYRTSASRLAYLMFSFDGTEFTWFTAKGPNFGKATITVDGVLTKTVDLYSRSRVWQYPVIIDRLEDKTHTVLINVLGQRNASSTGNTVIVDGFQFP